MGTGSRAGGGPGRKRRIAASAVVSLVLAVLVWREWRALEATKDARAPRAGVSQVTDPLLNHAFAANLDVACADVTNVYAIDERGCRFVTNRHGFKSPHPVEMPKAAGTWRVFVVGDSFVEGLCDGRFAMPGVLESTLAARPEAKGIQLEIVNTGVSGYATLSYELLIRERLSKLAPDVVVIAVDMTDPYDDTVLATVAEYDPAGKLLRLVPRGQPKKYSEMSPDDIVGWARMDDANHLDPKPWDTRLPAIEASMQRLGRAIRAARDAGARVVVTAVPRKEHFLPRGDGDRMSRRPLRRVQQEAVAGGALYFDTLEALEAALGKGNPRELFFATDDHFDLDGNALWGRVFAEFFLAHAEELLPRASAPPP